MNQKKAKLLRKMSLGGYDGVVLRKVVPEGTQEKESLTGLKKVVAKREAKFQRELLQGSPKKRHRILKKLYTRHQIKLKKVPARKNVPSDPLHK
jgi:hypothetical protein